MITTATPAAVAVRVRGVTKTYPGVLALRPVDLEIRSGSIHALVGENGAGKSTLLKILAGAQQPTAGTLEILGDEVLLTSPRQARRLGVVAVYQELTVLPNLTALENVFLGQTPTRAGMIDSRTMRDWYGALAERLGVSIDPDSRAGTLSIADQQVLEIMRALHSQTRVLLLDEPTASLAMHEREALGQTMRSLAAEGVTIVWISHDLDEVLDLSDEVSVFRDGSYVETRKSREWSKSTLVAAMLGARDGIATFERVPQERSADVIVTGLTVPAVIHDVSFTIGRGEIVGIAGLVGAGRTELLRALAGLDPTASGTLSVQGSSGPLPASPRKAKRLGIALAPEDRKAQGLVLGMSAKENLAIPVLSRVRKRGLVRQRTLTEHAVRVADRVGLAEKYLNRPVRNLSGGNQQKVVLGKWSEFALRLFLVDEPTRGIDINAKTEVYRLLDRATEAGTAVLLVSSELEELVEVCDRVLVLAGGHIVNQLQRADLSEEAILHSIFEVTS